MTLAPFQSWKCSRLRFAMIVISLKFRLGRRVVQHSSQNNEWDNGNACANCEKVFKTNATPSISARTGWHRKVVCVGKSAVVLFCNTAQSDACCVLETPLQANSTRRPLTNDSRNASEAERSRTHANQFPMGRSLTLALRVTWIPARLKTTWPSIMLPPAVSGSSLFRPPRTESESCPTSRVQPPRPPSTRRRLF